MKEKTSTYFSFTRFRIEDWTPNLSNRLSVKCVRETGEDYLGYRILSGIILLCDFTFIKIVHIMVLTSRLVKTLDVSL